MTSSTAFNITDEQRQVLELSISNIATGSQAVGKVIDGLTSSSLKRILKAVTHVYIAENIVSGKEATLTTEETRLVDKIFNLQEEVLGYTTLRRELEQPLLNNVPEAQGAENVEKMGE